MRGNPAPFLAKLIERIDRLKDEMVTAADYLAWAESLASSEDEARARLERARGRVRRASTRTTTGCSTRRARSTSAR